MYIIKNAWTSIVRNKSRNILIGVIVIVISLACTITLSIMNSADKIVKAYEEKYEVKATIGTNRQNLVKTFKKNENGTPENMINEFSNLEQVNVEDIDKYGDSEYVKNYFYTYTIGMNANGISEATDQLQKETTETRTERRTTTQNDSSQGGTSGKGGAPRGKPSTTTEEETRITKSIENIKAKNGAFTVIGYNSYTSMTDFIDGNYSITSGKVSSDFDSKDCVISEELAELNNLSVGSLITLVDPKNTSLTYELTVTGIYKENTMEAKDMGSMFSSSVNNIITNQTVTREMLDADSNLKTTITPTFILNNAESFEPFAEEVSEKGLNENFEVTSNLEDVDAATKGIINVSNFASAFLLITFIIGAVVLFVINMINIRERKYEIGVLRTIGMSKFKVIMQFVIELLVVAMIALVVGAGIGSVTSVPVANKLLETEIINSLTEMESISENFGGDMGPGGPGGAGGPGGGMGSQRSGMQEPPDRAGNNKFDGMVEMKEIEDIEAVVDFKVLMQLLGIGVCLTILSSLASCIAIARFSPLTILKERS